MLDTFVNLIGLGILSIIGIYIIIRIGTTAFFNSKVAYIRRFKNHG